MTNETWSIVKLTGTIDVRFINESFEKVKAAVAAGTALQVDLAEVTDIDLTFLQLIESLRRSAREAGTWVRLSGPARDPILETLQRAGFLCDPPDERTRFWLGAPGPLA